MRESRGFVCVASVLLAGLMVVPARSADEKKPELSFEKSNTKIDFKVGKDLITTYRIEPKQSKPYFYPMYAMPGVEITENGPSDHVHHRSAWFCHGDVIPDGLEVKKVAKDVQGVDFWSERKGAGKIVFKRVEEVKSAVAVKGSPDYFALVTLNDWETADGKKVLGEKRTITLYNLGPNRNLIVLDIDLEASEYPLTFGDTKEGSMGIRIRHSVRADKVGKGTLTNAEGKVNQKDCWGRVSDWCDYSGPVGENKVAGLTIFADPKNTIDTAWHARDYGLLAANPFGRDKHAKFPDRKGNDELVKLKKGEHLKLRYALYLHEGDVKDGKVAEAYKAFKELKGK